MARHYPGISLSGLPPGRQRDALNTIDVYLRDASASIGELLTPAAVGSTPPLQSSFITVNAESGLMNERQLTATSPIIRTDGGAGGTLNISLNKALLGGTPANTYATSGSAGSAQFFLRTDDTLRFPTGIITDLPDDYRLTTFKRSTTIGGGHANKLELVSEGGAWSGATGNGVVVFDCDVQIGGQPGTPGDPATARYRHLSVGGGFPSDNTILKVAKTVTDGTTSFQASDMGLLVSVDAGANTAAFSGFNNGLQVDSNIKHLGLIAGSSNGLVFSVKDGSNTDAADTVGILCRPSILLTGAGDCTLDAWSNFDSYSEVVSGVGGGTATIIDAYGYRHRGWGANVTNGWTLHSAADPLHWEDYAEIGNRTVAQAGTPASGYRRLFVNSDNSDHISVRTSAGTTVDLEAAGSGSGDSFLEWGM